ncbi:MAG: prepilin-type N-terminal cleavage/methylation domain-containing protein [Phycisphaerales bacterium]|nr:prepilin-type N-terminal cleavage/methylation domain-containing protein [Phycisphaerales bacterium]
MKMTTKAKPNRRSRAGFTLTELVVAIAAMVLVTLGVAKVFENTGRTIAIGRSMAELDVLAHAIERVMRQDFARVNEEGFLVIRMREINTPSGPRRADEIAFFTTGNYTTAQYSTGFGGTGVGNYENSRIARIYYGHGIPLGSFEWDPSTGPAVLDTEIYENALGYEGTGVGNGRNADPTKWVMVRQPLLLRQGAGAMTDRTAVDSVFRPFTPYAANKPVLASGLVDFADAELNEVRSYVMTGIDPDLPAGQSVTMSPYYEDFVKRMAEALPHPMTTATPWVSSEMGMRVELAPTGLSREDMMLTHATLAGGVSSIEITWSYDGVMWFGKDTYVEPPRFGSTEPYPQTVLDRRGRPIVSGLAAAVGRTLFDDPLGERLYGFGYVDPEYFSNKTPWKIRGAPAEKTLRSENTPHEYLAAHPEEFDPNDTAGSDANPTTHVISIPTDLMPETLAVPFPRLIRVRLTLCDSSGEFVDAPYTFTFELPKPAPTRPIVVPGIREGESERVLP